MARVVVTGLGLVTPLGIGVKKSWSRILSGDSAIRSTAELSEGFQSISSKVAAWISNIELESRLESERDLKALPKYIQFAALAADEAIKDAKIDCHSSLGVFGIVDDLESIGSERRLWDGSVGPDW